MGGLIDGPAISFSQGLEWMSGLGEGGLADTVIPAPQIALDFASMALSGVADPRITFSGAANGSRVNSNGNIVASVAPRWDFNPATLATLGLLVEEPRTNLAPVVSAWSVQNATLAGGQTSPDGGTLGQHISETSATGNHDVNDAPAITPGGPFSYSVYGKRAERTVIGLFAADSGFANWAYYSFDLTNGANVPFSNNFGGNITAGSSQAVAVNDGYYRCSISFTATTTLSLNLNDRLISGGVDSYAGTTGDGAIVYGAQLEAGAFPSSYIPAQNATRSADVATMPTAASFWNGTAFTWFIKAVTGPGIGAVNQPFGQIDDGTQNNVVAIYRDTARNVHCVVISGGVTQADLNLGAVPDNTIFGVAFAGRAGDFAASLNTGAPVTAAAGAIPAGLTTKRFGADAATHYCNGHLLRDSMWTSRLSNADLEIVSDPPPLEWGLHQLNSTVGTSADRQSKLAVLKDVGGTVTRDTVDCTIFNAGGPGVYDWTRYDAVTAEYEAASPPPAVVWSFSNNSPAWMNGSTHADVNYVPGNGSATDATFRAWVADQCAALSAWLQRYGASVKYLELGNECNEQFSWSTVDGTATAVTTADQYRYWFNALTAVVRNGYPHILVSIGGIAGLGASGGAYGSGNAFLQHLLDDNGGVPSFDAVAIHPYGAGDAYVNYASTFSASFVDIELIRQTLVSRGHSDKPLWVTEWSWYQSQFTDAQKQQYLAESMQMLQTIYPYVTVATFFKDVDDATYTDAGLYTSAYAQKPIATVFRANAL